ncbi:MAG TPA: HD domain-containing protein [Spirochaetota bacterium]|nr:HD domain-containing protein [Spirochaetota bacterium]
MNAVNFAQIQEGSFFTEDAYIFENLFFLPKKLPVYDYHLKLLRTWNIDKIYTEGIIQDKTSLKSDSDDPENLEDLFDSPESEVSSLEEIAENEVSTPIAETAEDFKTIYKKWIDTTIVFFNQMVTSKTVNKEKVANLISDIKSRVKKNKNESLKMFGRQIEGVSYIHRKTVETTILAYILSESMQLGDFASSNLLFSTLFHDLGMIKIPKEILTKKTALTKEDIVEIQNHTIYGYKVLREVGYSAIISSGALQHHERIDGKGYPNHVTQDKITDIAKIISVVDAYCAAIAERPFKNSLHAKEAVQDLLKSGGTVYEPSILRELVKNISFYPIGSFVLLSNDVAAEVIGTSGVAMRPVVKILKKDGSDGETVDLSKKNDVYIKGIYNANT